MSEENVETLRRIYGGLAEGDGELFWQHLDPDVVWDERDSDWPEARVYRGTGEVRAFMRRWIGAWEEIRWEAHDYADAGDTVVVTVRQIGKGRGSGARVEQERSQTWTFRDRKVMAFKSFMTRAEADEAAGLR
jgi:ketosteroid isomerase-like protein